MRSLPCINVWSTDSSASGIGGDTVSDQLLGTWPSANLAIFVPFVLTEPETITKMFFANGNTVSGNVDVGIYDAVGTRIVSSGSTAQSGTNTIQTIDITDTLLGPGLFYLAMAMDNATGTVRRNSFYQGPTGSRAIGILQMASAFALPATATFATMTTAVIPCISALVYPRTVI